VYVVLLWGLVFVVHNRNRFAATLLHIGREFASLAKQLINDDDNNNSNVEPIGMLQQR
jgi:hypothetical protein